MQNKSVLKKRYSLIKNNLVKSALRGGRCADIRLRAGHKSSIITMEPAFLCQIDTSE